MEEAQQEIRNTVTVNTSDLSSKNNDEKDGVRDGDKFHRKRGKSLLYFIEELINTKVSCL